ncbi:MAG TPA: apolipoprotein N-acyltransferase [Acidimicrobiia bacterium]|jgi:apolipoprotein N-acyltransferase
MSYLLAVIGAGLAVLAFPPFDAWPLAVVGPAVWLAGMRRLERPREGLAVGATYGVVFYFALMWWMSELALEAIIALGLSQAAYAALFGWAITRWCRRLRDTAWWVAATGFWMVCEWIRYRFPVGGLEWGALGYGVSTVEAARAIARWIGTTGLTVVLMSAAAGLATRRWKVALTPVAVAVAVFAVGALLPSLDTDGTVRVAVVQGSTPCPFVHCENERFGTYQQHLELTRSIEAGSVDLVVWSEGSTGSFNADPINSPEVGEAIAAEAARLGAWMVVGGDRPISDTHWVNANVFFSPEGEIVGEYRKQHPVPFGEYIPARPLFEWIPVLDRVPRDMVPGDGPVVFDLGDYDLGTVISFEGGFAAYAREVAREGADLLGVLTNEGSYGYTPASDQFIGMTRMRSAETGLDLIHAAVTGKSVIVTDGGIVGETTGLGTQEILYGEVRPRPGLETVYVRFGDWLMVAAMLGSLVALTQRRPTRSGLRPEAEA